jgi:tetratricopeptide (TPR) repeat protein
MPDDNPMPSGNDSPRSGRTLVPAPTVVTEKTIQSVQAALLPPAPLPRTERPLPRVEGYDVLAEVGGGAMGVVYKALHLRLKRVVALKMLRPGAGLGTTDWEHLLSRFRREAEALARLSHPHIVEVYDVGETPGGTPFFSLEFCSGGSLDSHLHSTPMPPAEAAALVRTLAEAMEAAHKAGIVHRDLKPANVLLSFSRGSENRASAPRFSEPRLNEDGTIPKITDFGLARKLDEVGQTHSGAVFGTPSYMAPEQARGRSHEAGPAADIWALGAILYECLTGRPPFKAATVVDTLNQVLNDDPAPPRQINHAVPRDLETICLKCLRKEPARRYPTAGALADDLGRFQRGESILARATGLPERSWRWARRQPVVAGLAAALVLMTVAALTVITLLYRDAVEQAHQARQERDEARRQRTRAEENLGMARQAVDALGTLGITQKESGQTATAQENYEQARQIYLRLARAHPDEPHYRSGLAGNCCNLANLLRDVGKSKEALPLYHQARDLFLALTTEEPANLRHQKHLAQTYNNLAILLRQQRRGKEALDNFEQSRRLRAALVKAEPAKAEYLHEWADALNNLGVIHSEQSQEAAARRFYEEARDIHRALVGRYPAVAEYRMGLAQTLTNLGTLQKGRSEHRAARESYEEAGMLLRRLVEDHPRNYQYQQHLAGVAHNLGNLQRTLGQRKEALTSFRAARAAFRVLVNRFPRDVVHRAALIEVCKSQAAVCTDLGLPGEVLEVSAQARDVQRQLAIEQPGNSHLQQELLATLVTRGQLLAQLEKNAEALVDLTEAVKVADRLLDKGAPEAALRALGWSAHYFLAGMLDRLGRYRDALAGWDRALALAPGEARAMTRVGRAIALARLGRYREAAGDADELGRLSLDVSSVYNLACVHSLCSVGADKDSARPLAEREKQAETFARRALAQLEAVRATGFFRAADNVRVLDTDDALVHLRGRQDYRHFRQAIRTTSKQ